jgi:hypothetical protein
MKIYKRPFIIMFISIHILFFISLNDTITIVGEGTTTSPRTRGKALPDAPPARQPLAVIAALSLSLSARTTAVSSHMLVRDFFSLPYTLYKRRARR